ncbi:hypothetical protein [Geothermobacter hydrogeniphilus]|uniref:hypothetical protein n=1 Tax=Geothermobacter hydrogeniphilus TaxID=1969733 RepID=UPI001304A8DA|nr:hypothetical protein [Geothermobacter hydrogeniphilus]
MLKYCAWCGNYQGAIEAEGYQIRRNVCEIDTSTICEPCHDKMLRQLRRKLKLH